MYQFCNTHSQPRCQNDPSRYLRTYYIPNYRRFIGEGATHLVCSARAECCARFFRIKNMALKRDNFEKTISTSIGFVVELSNSTLHEFRIKNKRRNEQTCFEHNTQSWWRKFYRLGCVSPRPPIKLTENSNSNATT